MENKEEISFEKYKEIVEYCEKNIFPVLFEDYFEKTFISYDFKELLEKLIDEKYKGLLDCPLKDINVTFNFLFLWLHHNYISWLESQIKDYSFLKTYFKSICDLDTESQDLGNKLNSEKTERFKMLREYLMQNKQKFINYFN